ncbi:hypothetical protein W97_08907 [Coniosporium apollinis CBS 100218]|uniref:Uncharacterized protein n=1 Tax=Coniosporium apollinis (strain CBS 100218) TaxID=1168221 RepID=R7Z665_CONA1|nr:uncharacterized protein W97_08907 [Coniosporium apollinis CBS 100218]EON69647.1 hypothetical protein W97_08907 [Coniosporium apollinis CBS 100218]
MAYTTTSIESAGATRYLRKHAGDGYLVPRPGRERFAASPGVHIPKAVGRVGSLGGLAASIACSQLGVLGASTAVPVQCSSTAGHTGRCALLAGDW